MLQTGPGMKLSVKTRFFDRAVVKRAAGAAGKVLSRFGAYVQRAAKSSLRPARQKTESEMTQDERATYRRRVELWEKTRLGKRPQRPKASSKPGEPPRVQSPTAAIPIKKILFAYDAADHSVIVGPVVGNSRGRIPETLEYGGAVAFRGRRARVEPRPFMGPAFAANLPHLRRWRNTVT